MLLGTLRLAVDNGDTFAVNAGDFVLIPYARGLTVSSVQPSSSETTPVLQANGEFRVGDGQAEAQMRMLIGHCDFASPDAELLVPLLPDAIHIHREERFSTLVSLVAREFEQSRPGRDAVLARLLEVLFIEALRASGDFQESTGLVRGLAEKPLASALRKICQSPEHQWTVAELARESGLSRSVFFDRFRQAVGITPMEYVHSWRMALSKRLLAQSDSTIERVAERVGYGSLSAFSAAFTRHVGVSPTRFVREGDRRAARGGR